MRENIGLFKAKDIKTKEWREGYYWTNEVGNHFIRVVRDKNNNFITPIDYEIDPETLCEFTGLTDKNGKLIFEGDKVKILYNDWMSKSDNDNRTLEEYLDSLCKIGTVEKNNFNGGWHLNFGEYYNNICCGEHGYLEVIGNKFEEVESETHSKP